MAAYLKLVNAIKAPIKNFGYLGANHLMAAASIVGLIPYKFADLVIMDPGCEAYKELVKHHGLSSGRVAAESFFRTLSCTFLDDCEVSSARVLENIMCKIFRAETSKQKAIFKDCIVQDQLLYSAYKDHIKIIGPCSIRYISGQLLDCWPVDGINRPIKDVIHLIPEFLGRLDYQNDIEYETKKADWKNNVYFHY